MLVATFSSLPVSAAPQRQPDGGMRVSEVSDSASTDTAKTLPSRLRTIDRQRVEDTPTGKRISRVKTDLDNPVDFSAKDSVVLIGRDRAMLYGDSKVKYGKINLDAHQIDMDLATSEVYAVGYVDSIGELKGKPVFSDNGTDYESQTMRYNFETQKGYITDVITQQGEGYLTGGVTKKIDAKTFYIENGRYTTCDNHEHPHFWLQLTKARVQPKKNIVTGPAYMVLAGLPLPLAVPFGYFPFSDKYSSGIIVPTFGEDYRRGFYMRDGGYYFAINDNIDLALTGEIYTKGSWGVKARSAYVSRYKFSGNFDASYLVTIDGDKGTSDYSKTTNFRILWSHTQDAKYNPNMTFSASVNFATSGYTRNDVGTYYDASQFTQNTTSSTINMTYRFPGTKWSLSTTANITQRSQDATLAVSIPNVTVTMSQLAPFKRKRAVGSERWYEKIKISYSGIFNNSLTAPQNQFFKKSLVKDWRNGMKHSVPISATFNLFQYFNLTPSVSITDRMYTNKVRRQWDPNAAAAVMDTTYGFYNVWDFNASLSLDTKVYGFFQPMKFLGNKVKMIRHVLTPTVSVNWAPDFSSNFFGYYATYSQPNADGTVTQTRYSMFPNSLFGVPGQGRLGAISLSLANNLEMKVRTNDSIGEKKISLIENLTLSQSYNMAADSLRLSNLNMSILLRLAKNFNLSVNSVWDPYTYALSPSGTPVRVDRLRISAGKGYARLSSAGTSFSYTFTNATFGRGPNAKRKRKNTDNDTEPEHFDASANDPSALTEPDDDDTADSDLDLGPDGYMKWDVPWSLSVNYSINYGYGDFNREKMEYNGKIRQNLSLSGSIRPTANWNISATASYDFELKKIAYMNCNISRDLHCFTMTASFVPVGPYKSYNFHIAVKSSLLQDLKYDKRSSMSNGVQWY